MIERNHICEQCGEPIFDEYLGRRKHYCSDACKQQAYRERRAGTSTPRRKMINEVRTDTLESKIAFYETFSRYEAAEALRQLASQIGAPISEQEITKLKKNVFKPELEREQAVQRAVQVLQTV